MSCRLPTGRAAIRIAVARLVRPILAALLLAAPLKADDTKLATSGPDGTKTLSGTIADLSADGRFVLFNSSSPDYVPGDTNGLVDLFVKDLVLGTVERVNVGTDGSQDDTDWYFGFPSSISADGRFVAFETFGQFDPGDLLPATYDIYLRDRTLGTTTLVSRSIHGGSGNGGSVSCRIARDGSKVVFSSFATDLVAVDTNGTTGDIFEWDRGSGTISIVSTTANGEQGDGSSFTPMLSSDGLVVAFLTSASNYPGAWHGRYDHNVFVKDVVSGTLERVDLDTSGTVGAWGTGLADLSGDGRFVLFSAANSLAPDDTDSAGDGYVRDRLLGTTELVTIGTQGREITDYVDATGISDDGRRVVYTTAADASGDDTNGEDDCFVFNRDTLAALRVSVGPGDQQALDRCIGRELSADGLTTLFSTASPSVWPGDDDGDSDVFVRTLSNVSAAWNGYGAGFPGRNGVPALTLDGLPRRGATIGLQIGNSSGTYSVAFLFVGLQSLDLATRLGGTLLVDPLVVLPISLTPWTNTQELSIPTSGNAPGVHVFLQALEIDPWAAKGVSFTPGVDMTLGD